MNFLLYNWNDYSHVMPSIFFSFSELSHICHALLLALIFSASCLEGREADLGDPCAGSRPNTARAWVNEPSVAKSIEDRSLDIHSRGHATQRRHLTAAPDRAHRYSWPRVLHLCPLHCEYCIRTRIPPVARAVQRRSAATAATAPAAQPALLRLPAPPLRVALATTPPLDPRRSSRRSDGP